MGIGQYNRERQILFEPGLEKVYGFQLSDSLKIDATLEGDLAQYATINDPLPGGPPRNIEVYLNLPDFLEPGVHILYIVASERAETTATIGGISSVRVGMEVFALYPGKRPLFQSIMASDVNIDEASRIDFVVINEGEETIEQAYGELSIFDQSGNFITNLRTDSKSVAPYERQVLTTMFDTSSFDLKPGNLKIVGNLTYDNTVLPETKENIFIIGDMNVKVIDYTAELFVNSTNKFHMTLESDWAGDINNVYARIIIPSGKTLKTPNVDLIKPNQGAKAMATIETYIETDKMPLGKNTISIEINYAGKVTNQEIEINIIDGKPPEVEKPNIITPMTIFIGLSVIIILFVAVYFLAFRKGGNDGGSSRPANNQDTAHYSNDDIKPPSL